LRIIAKPKTEFYGALSLFIQYHFEVEKLFDISPGSFSPPPKVFSSFVKLVPIYRNFDKNFENKLFEIIKITFSQRRKKIKNTLKNFGMKIDIDKRPEELSLEDFINLTKLCLGK